MTHLNVGTIRIDFRDGSGIDLDEPIGVLHQRVAWYGFENPGVLWVLLRQAPRAVRYYPLDTIAELTFNTIEELPA